MSVQGDSDSDAEAGARTPLLGSRGDDGSAASGARQRKADAYGHAATRAHESAQSVGSVGSDAPSRPGRKTLLGKKKRASAAAADPPLKGLKRVAYAVGMVCIVVMVLSWVAASELTQLVGSTYDYYEPVLLVWAAHTTFIAMTPVMLVAYARQRRESGRTATPLHMFVVEQIRTNFGSLKRGLIVCSLLGFMYTGSSIIWYTGTLLLPAGIASAVAQVQCVFAYIFSVWLLHEKVSCIRVGSVALCVCGTAVIMLAAVGIRIDNAADDDTSGYNAGHEVLGVIIMFVFCITWGLYEVLYEKYAMVNTTADVWLVLTLFGWAHLLVLWPMVPLANLSGLETFRWAPRDSIPLLTAYLFNGLLFDTMFNLSLALTSPLMVSVATVCAVPVTFGVDLVFRGDKEPGLDYVGGGLILCGFAALNYATWKQRRETDAAEAVQADARAPGHVEVKRRKSSVASSSNI